LYSVTDILSSAVCFSSSYAANKITSHFFQVDLGGGTFFFDNAALPYIPRLLHLNVIGLAAVVALGTAAAHHRRNYKNEHKKSWQERLKEEAMYVFDNDSHPSTRSRIEKLFLFEEDGKQ
jgi:hypothetical protein